MGRGKYAHVIDKLPRMLGTEPDYQEKVNAVKTAMLAEPTPAAQQDLVDAMESLLNLMRELVSFYDNYGVSAAESEIPGNLHEVQAKLDNVRLMLPDHAIPSPAELAKLYANLRRQKDLHEEREKEINLRLEAVSQLLTESYEASNIHVVGLKDGASVSLQVEPHAVVKDKEAFRLWCIAQGLERSLALPWQTTNSLTKEHLLAGEPEPDGVEAHSRAKLVLRNAK